MLQDFERMSMRCGRISESERRRQRRQSRERRGVHALQESRIRANAAPR